MKFVTDDDSDCGVSADVAPEAEALDDGVWF